MKLYYALTIGTKVDDL